MLLQLLIVLVSLGISTAWIFPKVSRPRTTTTQVSSTATTEPASTTPMSKIVSIGLDDEEFDEEDVFFGTGKVMEMMDDDKSPSLPLNPSITEWNPFKLFHWQNEDFDAGIFGENVLNTLEDMMLDVKRGLSPFYKSNDANMERSILTAKTRRWLTYYDLNPSMPLKLSVHLLLSVCTNVGTDSRLSHLSIYLFLCRPLLIPTTQPHYYYPLLFCPL